MIDPLSNAARYVSLRQGIKDLFTHVVRDMQDFESPNARKILREKHDDIKTRLGAALYQAEISKGQDKEERIIDSLISKWAGAQALVLCPEVLHDDNPEIMQDASDMLEKAEQHLGKLQSKDGTSYHPGTREILIDFYGLNDAECETFMRLEAASAMLEQYTDAMRLNSAP